MTFDINPQTTFAPPRTSVVAVHVLAVIPSNRLVDSPVVLVVVVVFDIPSVGLVDRALADRAGVLIVVVVLNIPSE